MDESRLLGLVGRLYDCAADPDRLTELGGVVQRAMDTDSSIHFTSEQRSGRMLHLLSVSPNFDPAARRDYARYYHDRNEWFQRAVRRQPPYVARGEELVDYHDFERTEFCTDWCARVGIFHMIGCVYPIADGMVGGSGVHKPKGRGAFDDEEKRRYGVVMSHFARAVQIAHRLGRVRQADALTLDVIDSLGVGVMLVRGDRSLVFANDVASALLRSARWFTVASGRVRPIHQQRFASFARRVGVAARTSAGTGLGTGGLIRLTDPIGGDLMVLIAPFRVPALGFGPRHPVAAVIFHDPAGEDPVRAESIAQAYGLSVAESRLVALLCAGNTLVGSASRAGVSVNTAKTQLRSVFAKTGFARQADLVADVLANPLLRIARGRGPDGRAATS